ncbi:hypothetical protein L3Y34_012609 [Caenorhabditis briggsae]|uniref:Uncharacterized protein n=1 Tax=Caenorhabditis briggsae TaxID=6238 RepID=A0AAE8ZW85_CAEBR|nr:hypothetical protein L3Y34_012609 [Caenorhabditis briggsae]
MFWCHKGHCTSWNFDLPPVPIDGQWSEWGGAEKGCPIQQCAVSGSITIQAQHRDCVNPAFCANPKPSQGGAQCSGSDFELNPCFDPARCHLRDGGWSIWSDWSPCSASCGFGVQTRDRTCSSPEPRGGQLCTGLAHQTSLCDLPACDHESDGEWSAWNEWSGCMGNCGFGTRTRVRACVSPPASHGGQPCFGRSSEITECRQSESTCSSFITSSLLADGYFIETDQQQ